MPTGSARRWGEDITGQAHDFLTCVGFSHVRGNRSLWDVRCDCGKLLKLSKPHFRKFRSCGCKRYKSPVTGRSNHPLYARWRGMIVRCRNPEATNFGRYGARGINVCRRWETFENFVADMEAGFSPGLTLERIDNRLGYSKENCRWATYSEQMHNVRSNVVLDTPWGPMIMKDAAARAGIGWPTLRNRIHVGWHPSRWFTPTINGGDRRTSQARASEAARRAA